MARSYGALNIRRTIAALVALLMTMALLPVAAFAQPAQAGEAQEPAPLASDADGSLSAQEINIGQGRVGNCNWRIEQSGRLVIEPAVAGQTGELGNITLNISPVTEIKDVSAPWRDDAYRDKVVTVYIAPGVKGSEQMRGLFYDCKNLTGAELGNLDTSQVRYANSMFENCTSLERYIVPNFNLTKATNIENMFAGCTALKSLDLRYVDTSNITNMARLFKGCSSLTELKLDGFKTKSATIMYEMFRGCSSLKTVDVSSFDTSKVQDMSNMFYDCSSLTSANLARFSTKALKTMSGMFYGCSSITSIDLANFEVSEDVDRGYMLFLGCPALERVSFGSAWTFAGNSSKSTKLPTADWRSSVTGEVYSREEIAEQRNNVADTYIKSNGTAAQLLIKTQGLVWSRGSLGGAVFQTNMPVGASVSVKVDGAILDRSMYDLNAETTIVTLKPSYLETRAVGSHALELVSTAGTASASFSISNDPNDVTVLNPVPMYRLYNPNSGEHHYTADVSERDTLAGLGWHDEGIGWVAPASGDAVYRLYNANGGEHHYTLDANERQVLIDAGWNDEGIGWRSGGGVELERQYNPNQFANNHNYTSDQNEKSTLLGLGWLDEGTAWYGVQ